MSRGEVPPERRELLLQAYAAYNAQDLETLLARLSEDVDWPDGERRMHGKEEVRRYWAEQWARLRAHDEAVGFSQLDDGRTAVEISQVVHSPAGAVLSQGRFVHLHRLEGERISRLDIEQVREP